jgi:hypothetical protein
MGPFAMTGLPDGMIAVVSRAAVAAHSVGSAVAAVAAQEHSASAFGIVADKMDIGALHLNGTCGQLIYGAQTNWLGYKKRGLALLLKECLRNGGFRLPSFSISLILFSTTTTF